MYIISGRRMATDAPRVSVNGPGQYSPGPTNFLGGYDMGETTTTKHVLELLKMADSICKKISPEAAEYLKGLDVSEVIKITAKIRDYTDEELANMTKKDLEILQLLHSLKGNQLEIFMSFLKDLRDDKEVSGYYKALGIEQKETK